MERADGNSGDAHYEQQWQGQLAYEARALQTLEGRQQEEKEQLYLYEINIGERALLAARHEAERKALAQEHRAMRITLRKGHFL